MACPARPERCQARSLRQCLLPVDEAAHREDRPLRAALYAEAGLPPLFRITPLAPPTLDAELEDRGYERIDHSLQQVALLDRPLPVAPDGLTLRSLQLEDWLEVAGPMRGQTPEAREAELRRLRHVERSVEYLLAYLGDEAVACGLATQEQGFVAPADIYVAELWRNRGIGRVITGALLSTAQSNGAEYAWLNVLAANTPAVKVYARLGFETLYEYWYRVKP